MIGCRIRVRPRCLVALGKAFFQQDQKRISGCEPEAQIERVNVAFKEPVHKILDQIKNETFFRWTNKMGGDPSWRNQNLYCTYHRDKGHTTE